MDGGTGPVGEMLSPGEAEWPPELRLPPPPPLPDPAPPPRRNEPSPSFPPPSPPRGSGPRLTAWLQAPAAPSTKKEPTHLEGFDDSQFLGSIMDAAAPLPQQQQQPAVAAAVEAPVVVKRKRGRPPKNRDGVVATPAPPKPVKKSDEEVVCFICFDGGSLVVCDRRGCPKVYHPACIKRDESFFQSRGKWNCGWHICSSCEKAVHYMCYTCTYSLCKGCIKQGKFFGVRGNKGFCDTCYGTILLIESRYEDDAQVRVDFDDKNSWEYLFKLYWLDIKGKHLLTLDELISAKSSWTVRSTSARREKEESSDELYDANNDHDSDNSSRKRKGNNLRKRGRKRQNRGGITARNCEISIKGAATIPKVVPIEGMNLSGDTKWASSELLEFIGHMRNGDKSHISQFDVQVLLLEYIKQNNLRDPCSKSQIICDARLSNLFRKPRVGHFEMLKLLDSHFHVKSTPTVNGDSQRALDPDSAQVDTGGYNEMATKLCCDKRRKTHKKIERDPPANLEDYAAIDMHNINLIYLRRSLMEDLIDDGSAFSEKITGAFVRIRISGAGQKQDMYRLVKVLGTHKVAERYSVGKKTTDCALEISNLDKKEVISMDTISNQDFTEEECKRLRQSMKYGLITRLKVGDIHEKAKTFQSLRINDWLENEKQRLSHLRDRASEIGRRKELRECVEKLQLLNTPEERERKINEVPEVHVDPHMTPNYGSAEEWNDKKTDWTINRNGPDLLFLGRKGAESNSVQYGTQNGLDAIHSMSLSPPTEGVTHRPGPGSNINLQSVNEWNIPRPRIDLNNTAGEAPSVSSSGVVSSDMEPEKVWHYKDPSGNAQGPFTLSQLSKWTSFFPRDMRIWLTFESEENSLLLTEVLSKQQKDFIQPTGKAPEICTGEDRSNSNVAESTTSPIGYNIAYSSGLSSQFAHCPPRKEGLNRLGGALPSTTSWEPLKDSQTLCHQTKHQANNPCTIPSSAGSYGSLESYGKGVPRENIGERNNRQDTAGMWSPTPPQRSHSSQIAVEPHPGVSAVQKQLEKYSKSDSLAGFAEIPQQSERDLTISLGTSSPSEFTTTLHKSHHSYQSNIVPLPEGCTMKKEPQNVPKSNLLPESHVQANFNLQMDFGLQKVQSPIPQQSERDFATPLGNSSTSEVKTMQKQEGICWSATINPAVHDEIQFSIAPAKHESCSVTNPAKDRDSDSASCLLSQSRAPSCSPQSVPSTCTFNSSKTEEIMNPHKICAPDAPNAPVNQRLEPKSDPVLCTDPEDQYPSPTPKLERKEPSVNQSELTSVTQDDSSAKAYGHSSIAFVSEASGRPGGKIVSLQLLKKSSCLEERDLKDGGSITQTEQLKDEPTSVRGETMVANPVSVAEAIAVSDVLESVTEQNCGTYNMHGATSLENFTRASAEEEQPQCSSPIALSPWGEASYYQSEAVDSAMWGVQDDPSNDMWSLSSPTPALQPSSGLGADGKDTSCIIEEVIVAQGNSVVMSPKAEDEKMEKCNSSASTGWGVPEQVKPKPSAGSSSPLKTIKSCGLQLLGSSLAGCTKASGAQPSGSLLDGSRKSSGSQPSGSFLEGNTKASVWQPLGSSLDGSTKASGWQPSSSSLDGSTKAPGWQPSGSSPNGSTKASGLQPSGSSLDGSTKASGWGSAIEGSPKASGWQPSGSSLDGSTKASGWQPSGSSLDGSTKASGWGSALDGSPKASGRGSYLEGSTQASGWLRSSSSPEGRKAPGWHSSGRESSKVNSTSSASQNRNSSSSHQTMTSSAKNSSEAPRRQGNTNTNTAGWGEALGNNNKSWHSSSGNASRGSQSSQHHDRYSRGNESRRGTSQGNESRRGTSQGNESRQGGSDHSRRSDYCQDHGSGGSSRSSSRGQPHRGICKYYESGHCKRGSSCCYLHR